MKNISIAFDDLTLEAQLDESPTAKAIWAALPIESRVHTWGEEIYFEIPVVVEQETNARADVEIGDLGYWPPGRAFCIFFGATPASRADRKPRAASPVNLVGRLLGAVDLLKRVPDGARVVISPRK